MPDYAIIVHQSCIMY